jgi:hypothetical protein
MVWGLQSTRRPIIAAAATGALALALAVTVAVIAAQSGDPGGKLLKQLQPAASAIPADSRVIYRHDLEPLRDSCDGRPGTEGWSDVVLQIHFSSSSPPKAVLARADEVLVKLGWHRVAGVDTSSSDAAFWQKRLVGGAQARTSVSSDRQQEPQTWTLVSTVAPVGTAASGC